MTNNSYNYSFSKGLNVKQIQKQIKFSLVILIFFFITACEMSARPDNRQPPINETNAATRVLILYNDGTPGDLRSESIAHTMRPGLVNTAVRPNFIGSSALQPQDLSTQTFNFQEAAQLYAIMLANLLGQFQDLSISMKPVSSYQAGMAQATLRTFYLGSTYGDPVPQALIDDVLAGAPVTWINYQIWQVVPFSEQIITADSPLGFSYTKLHVAYEPESYTSTFNKVNYRDFGFDKFLAPMEMVEVKSERSDVVIHAWAEDVSGRQIPYALQSNTFWYIADNPFAFIHETDRYLVFADLLGPMIGRTQTCEPRAIGRMEDLSPNDEAADLKRMLDILQRRKIPFAAATIPLHVDITTDSTVRWQDNPASLEQLRRVPRINGRIYQHGYTHQYDELMNPFGISGVDFEFWYAADDGQGGFDYLGPIPGQTPASALERVKKGQAIMKQLGFNPSGWVTPHYAASPDFYDGFNTVYPRVMERRLYQVGSTVAGQFFPYPVKDVYGTLILPETLGSVQPGYLIDRIMAAARANRALHCPWAGHFFHAYTINPQYDGPNALTATQFDRLIRDIQALGYRYVDPDSVRQR